METQYDKRLLAGFDFQKSTLVEYEAEQEWAKSPRVGEYSVSYFADGRLCHFSFGSLQGQFGVRLDPKFEAGWVSLGSGDGRYNDGQFFYSPPGFTEGDGPAGLAVLFEEWVWFSLKFVYERGQGDVARNEAFYMEQIRRMAAKKTDL